MSDAMKVVLLGTAGGGTPRSTRCGSALVVLVGDEPLVFDCGPGATFRLVDAGISPRRINHLFLTHHHFDHMVDYSYLVMASWLMGRDAPMEVYGPVGTSRITELLFGGDGVWAQDLRARTEGEASRRSFMLRHGRHRTALDIRARDVVVPGLVCRTDGWTVTAAPTRHAQPFMESMAYRVDAGDGAVVISGDTEPLESVAEFARGADILIHDCTRMDEDLRRLGIEHHHSGPMAVGRIAAAAGVRKVVPVHFAPGQDSDESVARMCEVIREYFGGEVIAGRDLLEVSVA